MRARMKITWNDWVNGVTEKSGHQRCFHFTSLQSGPGSLAFSRVNLGPGYSVGCNLWLRYVHCAFKTHASASKTRASAFKTRAMAIGRATAVPMPGLSSC